MIPVDEQGDHHLRLSREELDREYSPSSCVESLDFYLDAYARLSESVRRDHTVRTGLRYGDRPEETLDFFPGAPGGPVLAFLHGGNWQALTKDSSAFPARELLAAGVGFAAVDYGLAPEYRLDEIVSMVRRCLRWLYDNAAGLGFDPGRLHLAGTSAGAHLAAAALMREPAPPPAPAVPPVAGLTLLSGMYDLEPVRCSYVNEALELDRGAAWRLSPVRHLPDALPPVIIARGDNETGEYARQHALMAAQLREVTTVTELVVRGRNHFDLPYDLGVRGTPLGDAVLGQSTGSERSDHDLHR